MSRDINMSSIDRDPNQTRRHFNEDKIGELAQSMQELGLIVPVMIRPDGERFILVHGERRWRAAQALGWDTIPAEVREVTPEEAQWLSLIENIQRDDLSPIEEAWAYKKHLSHTTQKELGKKIGKTQSYIAQKLRLLKLPEGVQMAIVSGKIAEGHARQLLRLKDASQQSELCAKAIEGKWTVERVCFEVEQALKAAEMEKSRFILTPAGLIVKGETTFEEWVSFGKKLNACLKEAAKHSAELEKSCLEVVQLQPVLEKRLKEAESFGEFVAIRNTALEHENKIAEGRLRLERAIGTVLTKNVL